MGGMLCSKSFGSFCLDVVGEGGSFTSASKRSGDGVLEAARRSYMEVKEDSPISATMGYHLAVGTCRRVGKSRDESMEEA